MPPEVEWQMWRQLRGAFEIKRLVFVPVIESMQGFPIDQYDTMEEALATCEGRRYFLEPQGDKMLCDMLLGDLEQPQVVVLGNTACDNRALVRPTDFVIRIATPKPVHLYGINAAAIALACWEGQ